MTTYQNNDYLPGEASALFPEIALVEKSRKTALLAILAAAVLCVFVGFEAGKQQSSRIETSLVTDHSDAVHPHIDVDPLILAYPELQGVDPKQQEIQLSAYKDYMNGMSMDEVQANYEVGITDWFPCCYYGGSGCYVVNYAPDKPVCLTRNPEDYMCGFVGTARTCCRFPFGRKFWFWEPCSKPE